MKVCGCGQEFEGKWKCSKCKSQYQHDWYQKNKYKIYTDPRAKASKKKWRAKKTAEWVEKYYDLKRGPCMDCGKNYQPWQMQFDHTNNDKLDNIATMVHDLKPFEEIVIETKKCDLVCANCHADRTHKRLRSE